MTTNTTAPITTTAGEAVPSQPPAKITPMEAMRSTLTKLEAEFGMALPPQIPTQKFIRTTITALQMNADLLDADRRSVLAACMKAAQDGLLVDGREAALVVFSLKGTKTAQYMPMIGGLLKKLRNSGELASIAAHVAYENDEFRYELGDEERIIHRPKLNERGKPMAAYAIARTKDGAIYREVMSVEQIEQVRSVSRAKDGPWFAWWDEMARKTVLRRLLKRLPSSADLDAVLAHDNETNDLAPQVPDQPTTASPSRLRASIGIEAADATPADAVASGEGQAQ
ncbi:MAG: recombinase RecT [Planctomycetota bacterium]